MMSTLPIETTGLGGRGYTLKEHFTIYEEERTYCRRVRLDVSQLTTEPGREVYIKYISSCLKSFIRMKYLLTF